MQRNDVAFYSLLGVSFPFRKKVELKFRWRSFLLPFGSFEGFGGASTLAVYPQEPFYSLLGVSGEILKQIEVLAIVV